LQEEAVKTSAAMAQLEKLVGPLDAPLSTAAATATPASTTAAAVAATPASPVQYTAGPAAAPAAPAANDAPARGETEVSRRTTVSGAAESRPLYRNRD